MKELVENKSIESKSINSNKLINFVLKNNQIVMLIVVILIATIMTQGKYLRLSNISVLLSNASILGIIALGVGIVYIAGGLDLSVGSLLMVALATVAKLSTDIGLNIWIATLIAILVTALLGCINGLLVTKLKLPPFIATLGMLYLAQSLSWILISGGRLIQVKAYKEIIQPIFINLPFGANIFPVLLFAIALIIIGFILHRTRFGRYLYAIGGNEDAARVTGIPVNIIKIIVFTISGITCGLAAVVFLYRNISASPAEGGRFLLESIGAVMIGGVSMYGGEGSVLGILIGVIVLTSISSVLTIAGVPPVSHEAVLGFIVLGVVLLQRILKEKNQ